MENLSSRADIITYRHHNNENYSTIPQPSPHSKPANARAFGLCISNILPENDKNSKPKIHSNGPESIPIMLDNSLNEYFNEILTYSRELELKRRVKYGYMQAQTDITERMRGILVDWLVEVHFKFSLVPESLYFTVHLLDRFLQLESTKRTHLQLLGITVLLIACKYEEIYPPEIRDLVYIADNTYSREEIKRMEMNVFRVLGFDLGTVTSYRFLEYYSAILGVTVMTKCMAQYFLELALVEYKTLQYNDSLKAAMALYLASKDENICWNKEIESKIGYNEERVREDSRKFKELIKAVHKSALSAARKKFSHLKYLEVSKIKMSK
eukprot:TRINITY_DN12533_c0_g1_i2.p1 TRINITY_DN12533_c0_g1~~TRINITY_DN12533_c0_g1_i2.p1  ORF type:complete len:325 (-),score=79.37 TRINITY_DN12533_c0_g1_i2:108-1082(-)